MKETTDKAFDAAGAIYNSNARALERSKSDPVGRMQLERHWKAMQVPAAGVERALVQLVTGAGLYLDAFEQLHECKVAEADEAIAGPFFAILAAARSLLCGEIGRLDGGTVDSLILELGELAGYSKKDFSCGRGEH